MRGRLVQRTWVLDYNAIAVNNSIYDYIKYDSSTIENLFAKDLDNITSVRIWIIIQNTVVYNGA